jgi:hypothetical protein
LGKEMLDIPPHVFVPPAHCKIMDGFAIAVQLILALVAFSSLLIKRHLERPKRPFQIWLFDVSKQALGGGMLHTLNLVGAYIGGRSTLEESNPCVWYFLNILLDTTVGVWLVYIFLRVHKMWLVKVVDRRLLHSGYYGHPPEWRIFSVQAFHFWLALLSMKLTVLGLLTFKVFFHIGEWILQPLLDLHRPQLEVVVVMLAFPLVMNVMQFWLIDGVIKRGGRLESKKRVMLDEDGVEEEEGETPTEGWDRYQGEEEEIVVGGDIEYGNMRRRVERSDSEEERLV